MAKLNFGNLGNVVQGALGNMSEQNSEDLQSTYQEYLFDDEVIEMGYKLIRDEIIFTNIRILFIDKQGATGKKTSFKSIFLTNIVDVEMETAGFGIDDSEIEITYLTNVKTKAHNEEFERIKFEFPKRIDITPLYRLLGNLVVKNRNHINS